MLIFSIPVDALKNNSIRIGTTINMKEISVMKSKQMLFNPMRRIIIIKDKILLTESLFLKITGRLKLLLVLD